MEERLRGQLRRLLHAIRSSDGKLTNELYEEIDESWALLHARPATTREFQGAVTEDRSTELIRVLFAEVLVDWKKGWMFVLQSIEDSTNNDFLNMDAALDVQAKGWLDRLDEALQQKEPLTSE